MKRLFVKTGEEEERRGLRPFALFLLGAVRGLFRLRVNRPRPVRRLTGSGWSISFR